MTLRRAGFRVVFSQILVVVAVAHSLAAQPAALASSDNVTGDLQRIATELIAAVNRLEKHVDDAIARYGHGYRASDGKRIQGADADLATGQADIVIAAARKLMLARMLAARGPGYEPIPVADADHIQDLITEARERIDASDRVLGRLMVVSVKDLDLTTKAEWKGKHGLLLRARAAAEEAAKKAVIALPIDEPEGDSEQEKRDQAWDLVMMGNPLPQQTGKEVRDNTAQESSQASAKRLRIRAQAHTRITLIHHLGYLTALTDSGTEDHEGRHVFYQEEWIQRGMVVLRTRWRVGVETKTGQHVLIKQYRTRELHGVIDELYQAIRNDYLPELESLEE